MKRRPQAERISVTSCGEATTPSMPAGATNLSIGMGLDGMAGSLTMDDFGAFLTP